MPAAARAAGAAARTGAPARTARPVGGIAKRGFDIAVALAALVLFLPLFLGIVLMVRRSGPGPVLYGHTRIGFAGRPFRCLKFRTMVTDGDAVLARHLRDNPAARVEWDATRKLTADPRVTPLGHALRKLSLDELPQLLNVLRGEMSLVGPRPVVAEELARYGRSARYYLGARPGLTGLWQVSGRNDISYRRRVAFDRAYVGRWSPARDAAIIARTVPAVLLARGSY
ncbi:MAG: sugar transferase [Rhodobacteraceae bacterium]|nr:sugar transferase [Paracoccaceae bacterium]